MMIPRRSNEISLSILLTFVAIVLAGAFVFFFPAFIVRPFRHQAARELALALTLRQNGALWTTAAAALAISLGVFLWPRATGWQKAALVAGVLLTSFSAVMARQNYFEWMFHPLPAPGFESASKAQLDAGEMVMAVRFGTDARAYPIRAMGYHHVINDTVGGVPVVVTY